MACLGYLPGVNEPITPQEEMSFVLPGFANLSKNLVGGAQAETTPARLLDKDLELYNKKCSAYCNKLMTEASSNVSSGATTAMIEPPDPLQFWNVQVCFCFLLLVLLKFKLNSILFVSLKIPGNII